MLVMEGNRDGTAQTGHRRNAAGPLQSYRGCPAPALPVALGAPSCQLRGQLQHTDPEDGRVGEAEDREAEAAKLPTGGLWLGATAFVVLIVGTRIGDASPAPVMRGLSVTLLGLAVIFGGLAFVQLRRNGASTTVAQRGLYAIVRHPQYLGADFLAWGLATSAPHWGTIVPAVALTAALSYQARAEEGYLLEVLGDAYRAYMRTVPRFGLLTGLVRYARRARRARVEAP